MKYILGLTGHPDTNKEVKKIINDYFDNISIYEIDVIDGKDINIINLKMNALKNKCMAILFTAKDIYHLFYSKTKLDINSAYLDDNKPEVLKTLLKATLSENTNIFNISIDSLNYNEIRDIYSELELDKEKCQILTIPAKISNNDLVETITSAHIENYRKFQSTCITFFTETRNILEKNNIPVLKVGINKDEVVKRTNKLISKKHSNTDKKKDRVAILIMLSDLKEHLILNNSEYNILMEYNRISEAVYWFSEKLDGAYIPNDQRKYIIFCNKERYESASDFSSSLDILNDIAKKNYFYCNIGVGYGESDRIAIKNATIAQNRASKEKRCSAYIMYDKDKIIGPILPSTKLNRKNDILYDIKLSEIASMSSLSIDTIYKIQSIIAKSGETDFTSKDISEHLGITVRSSNRLFSKLLKSGYVKMIGEKSTGEKGRPIRIYRFLF